MAVKYFSVKACQTMFTDYPDVVGIKEICKMLGIGRDKAYQLVNTGELMKIPCSRSIKVPAESFKADLSGVLQRSKNSKSVFQR